MFISVDEIQAATRQDLVDISAAIQRVIGDLEQHDIPDSQKKGFAVAFAGLPSVVDELLDDHVLTFLSRAQRHELAEVGIPDIRNAYVQTIGEHGKSITDTVAMHALRRQGGIPT